MQPVLLTAETSVKKQNKTKQNKTKQNKTQHNKTSRTQTISNLLGLSAFFFLKNYKRKN
jgi:ribonuclease PH